MPFLNCNTLEEYIKRYQVDGITWKANRLLSNEHNPILINDKCMELATMLSYIPDDMQFMRDKYVKDICASHGLSPKTFNMMIAKVISTRAKAAVKKVKKNKVVALQGNPKTFPFFQEFVREDKNSGARSLDKVKIDKLKFVQLLASFGFSRYETGIKTGRDEYNFVRIFSNVISAVTRDQIIDFIERYVREVYDFEAAKCEFLDADKLITTFYDQIKTIFSKDIFARVRQESPIIINQDKATITYLYFKNGYVEVTNNGWKLIDYKELEGSVWDSQLKQRDFQKIDDPMEEIPFEDGTQQQQYKCVFADFVWKICGQEQERFLALCCIIGYLVHDYYEYNLRMVYFTDSTISDNSEGRTGKTLLMKMVGMVRSFCEINGKYFNPHDEKRYETVSMGTQLIHINDVSNSGKNKYEVEPMFNDITEGLHVRALYMAPFRQRSKIAVSGNKSLYVAGDSAAARVLEFEMSNFFSIDKRPDQFYKHWFGRDWDNEEWNRFDNFICMCAQLFHVHGLKEPPVINLLERKLRDQTSSEFIEWMGDIAINLDKLGAPWPGYVQESNVNTKLSYQLHEFAFDKKKLYDRFREEHPDFRKDWFTIRKFYKWLAYFSDFRMHVKKPREWKSNGVQYLQFVAEQPNQ